MCSGYTISLLYDDAINGGGVLSSQYIPGSSQMGVYQIPWNVHISELFGDKRVWSASPTLNSDFSVISNFGNGTRIGRFSLSTSASSFANFRPNLKWNFNSNVYGSQTYFNHQGFWGPVLIVDSSVHFNYLSNPILPVELVSFKVNITNEGKVLLDWKTATEVNNYGFEIERSIIRDKSYYSWEKIGFVAGSGNSSTTKNYNYVDKNLNGGSKFAYRLKQIDNNATFTYSSTQEVELIFNEYILSQNYPNPFNPITTIEYVIPQAGQVTFSVYNLLGEQVSELIDEFKECGIYTIDFDASNLSSGSYIYILRSNGNTVSKKLSLIK